MTDQLPWQRCHLFLLKNCDGFHADRFLFIVNNTPTLAQLSYDANTYDEQIVQLVDFWIMQMASIGQTCTMAIRNNAIIQAKGNLELWLQGLLPSIEQYNLPIINGANNESQSR